MCSNNLPPFVFLLPYFFPFSSSPLSICSLHFPYHRLDRFVCCTSGRLGAIHGRSVPGRALARHQTSRAAQPEPEINLHLQPVSTQIWKHIPVAEISRKLAQSQPHSRGETGVVHTVGVFQIVHNMCELPLRRILNFDCFRANALIMEVRGQLLVWAATL